MSEPGEKKLLGKAVAYLNDVVLEIKRSTWPDRRSLVLHTIIVVAGVFALGLYVGISDRILAACLRWLVPQG